MKNLIRLLCILPLFALSFQASAGPVATKDGVKTGAETVINGAALIGTLGAASAAHHEALKDKTQDHKRNWQDMDALYRSRLGVTELGK
jgi:hypothetical protein